MTPRYLGLSRRRFLVAGAAMPVLAVGGGGFLLAGCTPYGGPNEVLVATPGFLTRIANLVIPRTQTPSAGDAGVGDYMARAFEHQLSGGDANTAGALEAVLDERVPHGLFMRASAADQQQAVATLDAETFAHPAGGAMAAGIANTSGGSSAAAAQIGTSKPGTIAAPTEPKPHRLWRTAKNAILVGYYMSEPGASRELRYELVPGRFDPDIPYKSGDTYLSNNWMANGG